MRFNMPKALSKSKHGRKAGTAGQSTDQVDTPCREVSHRTSKEASMVPKDSCPHLKPHRSTLTSSKDEKRRDKVLQKICARASSHIPASAPATDGLVPVSGISGEQRPSVTLDQLSLWDCPLTISTTGLWGSVSASNSAPPVSDPVAHEPAVDPTPSQASVCQHIGPEQLQQMIAAAVQQSLSATLPTSRVPSVIDCPSISLDSDDQEDSLSAAGHNSPTASHYSCPSRLGDVDSCEPDLSDDEGLPPEQPAFSGLFPQALFKSLLYKAVNTVQLGSTVPESISPPVQGKLNPLFEEPAKSITSIPTPPLFLDVLKRQWASPGSAPLPSSMDQKNFNIAADLASLLHVPIVDALIAALLPNTAIPGSPDEGLRPEERPVDLVLQRAHLGTAWVI